MSHRIRTDLEVVRPSDIDPEPWANGLGVTRVMAAQASWRISVAEIEGEMPFSPFPGADRVLIPLGARALAMTIDGERREAPACSGIQFTGEDEVVADTRGERISVVNLMSRRSSGRLEWEIGPVSSRLVPDVEAAIVLDGPVSASARLLPPGTVVLPQAFSRIAGGPGALVVSVRMCAVTAPRDPIRGGS